MPTDIEYHYNELKKRHALPDFALVDKEFEISAIEKPAFLMRNVRRKIAEKLDDITQFLEILIQPDPNSFSNLFEYRALTEAERRELLKQFQTLMALYRLCVDAELSADDATDAAVISRAAQEWPAVRAAVRPMAQKIAAAWPKSLERRDVAGYFG